MILAVNTSTMQFSTALIRAQGGTILAEYIIPSREKNFKLFMPAVNSLITYSGFDVGDIKAVVVAMGPGSFTGLRVGLSMAKGMAQGLHIPIIGVSTLEAMASQLPYTDYPICTMISSRKGEVFIAMFNWMAEHKMKRIREDISLKLEELVSMINGPTLFLGNDLNSQGDLIKELLGDKAFLAPAYLWGLRASAVGSLGLTRFINKDFDNLRDMVPIYLRHPDIRINPFPLMAEE